MTGALGHTAVPTQTGPTQPRVCTCHQQRLSPVPCADPRELEDCSGAGGGTQGEAKGQGPAAPHISQHSRTPDRLTQGQRGRASSREPEGTASVREQGALVSKDLCDFKAGWTEATSSYQHGRGPAAAALPSQDAARLSSQSRLMRPNGSVRGSRLEGLQACLISSDLTCHCEVRPRVADPACLLQWTPFEGQK